MSAEAMLVRAVDSFTQKNKDFDIKDLQLLTDEQLLDLIITLSPRESMEFRLIDDLRKGVVYKKIYEYKVPKDDNTTNVEVLSFIRGVANPRNRRLMYEDKMMEWTKRICPSNNDECPIIVNPFSIESQEQRVLDINIIEKTDSGYDTKTLENIFPELKTEMVEWVNDKRRFSILASPRLSNDKVKEIIKECKIFFK